MNYRDMGEHMASAVGMDAAKWTEAFREFNPDCNVPDDVMIGWFANAIMNTHDILTGSGPVVLPDGSGCCVGVVRSGLS